MKKTSFFKIFYKYTPDEGMVFWMGDYCSESIFSANGNLKPEEITKEEGNRRLRELEEANTEEPIEEGDNN